MSSTGTMNTASVSGPPGPPGGGGGQTNAPVVIIANINTNIIATGAESLLVDTFPSSPNPAMVLPSWATIHSSGIILTTNGLIDTNAVPSDWDGMPAGVATGVLLTPSIPLLVTRGQFLVLLTNSAGQLANTKFEVKVLHDTNVFAQLFSEETALAEYQPGDTNVSLVPVSGLANVYTLSLPFPPCICAAPRVICIRTESVNFDLPFSEMLLLAGNTSAVTPSYTTDHTNNFVLQPVNPALRLWAKPVTGVGVFAVNNSVTPFLLKLFTTPGAVITTTSDLNVPFQDYLVPDNHGGGQGQMITGGNGFFSVRVDAQP